MAEAPERPWVPNGSDQIAHWARLRGCFYSARPDEGWFRHWEPHDTMVAPEHFYNACTVNFPAGNVVIVEPWTAGEQIDPLERTLLAYATHPAFTRRAAMRTGEPFLTRVAFLESPPPPKVTVGDKVWDEHVTTFAASQGEALAAFTPAMRDLLRSRGFKGHLELRPGGFVVHPQGLLPRPDHYDMIMRIVLDIVGAAAQPSPRGGYARGSR